MNTQNILALADLIEQLPEEQFDMQEYLHPGCGTPACIAGWAAWLQLEKPEEMHPISVLPEAFNYFGVPFTTADLKFKTLSMDLFLIGTMTEGRSATPIQAAAVLRHFAATGEVNWELPE